jgi:hypothetical protein
MILGINGIIASSSFDKDYQAILKYATSLGYALPIAAQQVKQNKLIVDLKAAGIWNKLDTFGVFAVQTTDGSSNFALIDWKRLIYYTGIPTLTFSTNGGFTGNGTSAYIDLNYNAATQRVNYGDDNAHQMIWMKTAGSISALASSNFASGRSNIQRLSSANNGINSSLATSGSATAMTVGFIMYSRNNSTTYNRYNNTSSADIMTQTRNQSGGTAAILRSQLLYADSQISMQSLGADLSTESSTYYTILNTYMSSL